MAFLELVKNTRSQARQLAAEQAPLADARPIMAEAQVAVSAGTVLVPQLSVCDAIMFVGTLGVVVVYL